jgi:DNA-binding transcriptional LysR family regulator
MKSKPQTRCLRRPVAGLLALCLALPALAGEHSRAAALPPLPLYQTECGTCHLAFPPNLLPAAAWQRVMQTLPRHYGTDASLDAPTVATLQTWLVANAGSGKRVASGPGQPPEDRITRGAWFVREHREVAATVWKQASVKSPANCAACHTAADQGDFHERNIRIPR